MSNATQVTLTNGVPTAPSGTVSTLDNLPNLQLGSIGSLPLPSGAAQETGGNLAATAAVAGVTSGAAVITDANGTLQQYLRGLVKLIVAGISVTVSNALSPGRNTAANSSPVVLASQNLSAVIAASTGTATALSGGGGGASGDWLDFLTILPASLSPGAVTLQDGSGTAITVFAGGASSVASLAPITVPIRANSKSGAWKVTTGASVSVFGSGNIT